MAFNIVEARGQGYSDEEIATFLAEDRGFNLDSAMGEGYSHAEVADFLSQDSGEAPPEDKGFMHDAGDALKRIPAGFARTGLTAAEGAIEGADALTNMVGLDDLIDSGDDNEAIRWMSGAQESIEGWVDPDASHFDQFLEGVGSMGAFLAAQLSLGKVSQVAKLAGAAKKAVELGGGLAFAGSTGAGEQAQMIQRARDEGVEVSQGQEDTAIAGGTLTGFTELLPVHRLLKGLNKPVAGLIPKLKRALITGGMEGLQELSARIMQDLTAKGIYNPDLEVGDGAMQDFIVGGEVGTAMDLMFSALSSRRRKGAVAYDKGAEQVFRDAEAERDRMAALESGDTLALQHLPPPARDPNDPASVAAAQAEQIEQTLGDSMPLSGWKVVETKPDPTAEATGYHVVDGSGQQHGPDYAQKGQADILAGMMIERANNRSIRGNVELSVDQTPQTYTPSIREKLVSFGMRMLHPSKNLISAEQLNYAAGTTAMSGYLHEGMSLDEALEKQIPAANMTIAQKANAARRKAGKPVTNKFTIGEARKLLGNKIGGLADTQLAHTEEGEQYRARMLNGKPIVGGVLVKPGRRKHERVGALIHERQRIKDDGSATERTPFKTLAEAKQYAEYLNKKVADGTLMRGDLSAHENVKVADIRDLLLRKNVTNNLKSGAMRLLIKQATGRSVDAGQLTAGEKGLLYNRLKAIPNFEAPTALPSYKMSPYTASHVQTATQALQKDGAVLPRPQLEKVAGKLSQKAYDRLVKDLAGNEQLAAERAYNKKQADEVAAQQAEKKRESDLVLKELESTFKGRGFANNFKLRLTDYVRNMSLKDGDVQLDSRQLQGTAREAGVEGAFFRAVNAITIHLEALKTNPEYLKVAQKEGATQSQKDAKLVEIALETLNHETLHMMRAADLFTEREWTLLEKLTARKVRGSKEKGAETYLDVAKRKYRDKNPIIMMEEAIAEVIRDGLSGKLPVGGTQKNILNRIKDFFKELVGFESKNNTTFASILAAIESGEIGGREKAIRTFKSTEEVMVKDKKKPLMPERYQDHFPAPVKGAATSGKAPQKGQSQADYSIRDIDDSLENRRQNRELKGFRNELSGKINEGVSAHKEAIAKAVDLGHFDGYNVGDRLQGKSVLTITGHDVERFQEYRRGNKTHTARYYEARGIEPLIVESGGEQWITMLWYEGDNGNSKGQLYLDGVKAQGMKKFSGPRAVPSDPEWLGSEREDPFYSALNLAVVNAEGMPKKGTAAQFKAWLDGMQRKGNIKAEEREWMGVDEWLAEQGTTTRDALQKFVYENQTVLVENLLGGLGFEGRSARKDELITKENNGTITPEEKLELDELDELDNRGAEFQDDTKHGEYVLDGGTDYKELLIRLPNVKLDKAAAALSAFEEQFRSKKGRARNIPADRLAEHKELRAAVADSKGPAYRGDHYEQDNILVHIRFNTRVTSDGKKMLFIEEVQSDLHQEGKEDGYAAPIDTTGWTAEVTEFPWVPDDFADMYQGTQYDVYDETGRGVGTGQFGAILATSPEHAIREMADKKRRQGIPDMPFKQSRVWGLLAMKRAIRYASENGFDSVGWTTGEQQADRYKLSNVVESIKITSRKGKPGRVLKNDRNIDLRFKKGESVYADQWARANREWDELIKNRVTMLAPVLQQNPDVVRSFYKTFWEQRSGPGSAAGIKRMAELDKALDPTFTGPLESPNKGKSREAIRPQDLQEGNGMVSSEEYLRQVHNKFSSDYEFDAEDSYEPNLPDEDVSPILRFEDSTQTYTFKTGEQANTFRLHGEAIRKKRADIQEIEAEMEEDEFDQPGALDLIVDNESGIVTGGLDTMIGKPLGKVVGSEMAERIMEAPITGVGTVLDGKGLEVGGEGMKGFYDNILPNALKKYIKKWGGRISGSTIALTETHANELTGKIYSEEGFEPVFDTAVHSFEMTDKMRDSALEGAVMFSDRMGLRDNGPVDDSQYMEMRAWHGSPHKFSWFDLNKIGTGEGFQAFGWGIYFADRKSIGEYYADNVTQLPYLEKLSKEGKEEGDDGRYGFFGDLSDYALDAAGRVRPMDVMLEELRIETLADARSEGDPFIRGVAKSILARWDSLALEAREAGLGKHNVGELRKFLYEVEIPDEMIDRVLNWNRPLTEQPGVVTSLRTFFSQFGDPAKVMADAGITMQSTGEEVYGAFTGENVDFYTQKDASQTLKHAGISGIRFLDSVSRDDGSTEKTMNTVIFDMTGVEVLRRNGKPISQAKLTEEATPKDKKSDDGIRYSTREVEPEKIAEAVALNKTEAMEGASVYWPPNYSTHASPEAQYIARNPEAALDEGYKYSEREVDLSPEEAARIKAVIGTPVKAKHPMDRYDFLDDANKPTLLAYHLTKFKQGALNRYARMEQLNNDTRLRDNLADSSSIGAMLMQDRAMGFASAGFKYGPIIYHNGAMTAVSQHLVDDLAKRGHTMELPDHVDLSTAKGLTEIFGKLHDNPFGNLEDVAQAFMVSQRSRRLLAEGKKAPVTMEEIAQLEADIERYLDPNTGENIIKRFQEEYRNFNEYTIHMLKDTGVLTEETAEIWRDNADYYPFYRVAEGARSEALQLGQRVFGGMTSAVSFRKLKGGEEAVNMPMGDAIALNFAAAIQMGLKNVAQQRVVRDLTQLGLAREVRNGTSGTAPTVEFKVNGETRTAEIYDPLVYESMLPLEGTDMVSMVRNTLGKPATFLREAITREPGFMMVNLFRDSLSSTITAGGGLKPLYSTMKGLFDGVSTLEMAGTVGGYDFSNDPKDLKKFREAELIKNGYKDGSALNVFKRAWDFLGRGTTHSDAATRNAVFDNTIRRTNNFAEAQLQSLEVINFGRHGNHPAARMLGAVVPFLNARFQGVDLFWRAGRGQYTAKHGLTKGQITASFMARASLMLGTTAAYYLMFADDDQYKDQPDFVKDNNWIFPTPWGTPILIPVPFEVGLIFKTVPETVMATMMSGKDSLTTEGTQYDIRTGAEARETLKRGRETTFEISLFAPQFYGPFMEAVLNHNAFTGRDIVPKYMLDSREPWDQSEAYTDEIAKFIGKKFNMSPMRIQHMYEGYAGTMGVQALSMVDWALKSEAVQGDSTVTMPALPWYKYPMIKRFSGDPVGRAAVQDAYDVWEESSRASRQLKDLRKRGDTEAASAYFDTHRVALSMKKQANFVKQTLGKFRKQAKRIREADMDADWKKTEMDALNRRQHHFLNKLVPAMEQRLDKPYWNVGAP